MFDKGVFKKNLEKARGNRDNQQYANDANISRAYISKYMNLKLDKPPSPEVIKKLTKVAENNVTYDEMMKAAGHIINSPSKKVVPINSSAVFENIKKNFEEILEISYLPVVGDIAAGISILAEENIEAYLPYPKSYSRENHFILRVQGNSMIEAGINNGDMVVIRMQPTAENGQIAAIRTADNGITLKKFYSDGNTILLKPCNGEYSPLEITENATIIGIAVLITKKIV